MTDPICICTRATPESPLALNRECPVCVQVVEGQIRRARANSYDLFGVECGRGWQGLYLPLIARCQAEGVPIHQVKEKFGGLRFYVGGGSPELEQAIEEAETLSYKTCEDCGTTEGVETKGEWIRSLCSGCRRGHRP
jgi:hypothetical protein